MLNRQISEIDNELEALDQQIIYIEIQKANLLKRKKCCESKLKDLKPTSSGGNKHDSASNWNRKGTPFFLKTCFVCLFLKIRSYDVILSNQFWIIKE